MPDQEWELVYHVSESGGIPYREWFESLNDFRVQAIIDARLLHLRLGNFGRCEPLGPGIFELKIYYGPGYRIYFGKAAGKTILLLCGGDKSTQRSDIHMALRYWKHYKERRK